VLARVTWYRCQCKAVAVAAVIKSGIGQHYRCVRFLAQDNLPGRNIPFSDYTFLIEDHILRRTHPTDFQTETVSRNPVSGERLGILHIIPLSSFLRYNVVGVSGHKTEFVSSS